MDKALPPSLRSIERIITQRRDFSLVKSAIAGDEASFSKLMSLYKTKITALAKGFFREEADIDDFVQEVFLRVYTKLDTFRGESMFSTWLTRLAYNIAVNSVQRRKTYLSLSEDTEIASPGFTPEENEIRRITKEAVREAISSLEEKYAVCLDLYFFHDIQYSQISEITGFPENTIKSHIFRAKKILKEKLKELV